MVKKILFLMSDTGGGHRAAAKAITDALVFQHGEASIDTTLVDVYRQCSFPYNHMPEFYPWIVKHAPKFYGHSFHSSNTRLGSVMTTNWIYYSSKQRLFEMVRDHQVDVVVSVHSVITRPSMRAYQKFDDRPPFLTVVTDLVTTHRLWFDTHVDRCYVPTQAAYDRALDVGMQPEQLRLTGLPVNPGFTQSMIGKTEARAELGWRADLPTILLVGGGDGMGPLLHNALAINEANLNCELAIIAGRNRELKATLEAQSWHQPTHIYGFVDNLHEMPHMMAAAEILVTKAGPATISEACIAGLPMILYSAIPGQEEGNVEFVQKHDIGAYAPSPRLVVDTLRAWLNAGDLAKRAERARRTARPDAVWEIADEIWQYAHQREGFHENFVCDKP